MKLTVKLLFILVIFGSCASNSTLAQSDGSKKAKEAYFLAETSLIKGDYEGAILGFEEAIEIDPNFKKAHIAAANIYQYMFREFENAIIHYKKAIDIDNKELMSYYELANCYLALEQFDQALPYAKTFAEGEHSEQWKWKANLLKKNIEFAKLAVQNKVEFEPINMGEGVNSELAEYFPAITADNSWLYFTVNNDRDRYPNEDIFGAEQVDGEWMMRKKVPNINSPDSQEGAHSVTQDGRYLFFASDRMEKNQGRFDIYVTKKVGNEWGRVSNMGNLINTHNWESQPVISADSKFFFFIRKSSDGFGGSDIYVSEINEEIGIGEPKNMGEVINTPGDEQRPYLHPDGKTLYFASNGHVGLGESDIFMSKLQDDGSWGEPINLGYPINTVGEENGLYVSADGLTGFIASNREGGFGNMDIYSFEMDEDLRPGLVVSIKGTVIDGGSKEPIKANVKIIDVGTGEIYKTLSSDVVNGNFLFTLPAGKNYACQASADSYLPYSANFSLIKAPNNSIYELEVEMQKIVKGQEFVLRNIFFEEGKYELKEESKVELDILVKYLAEKKLLYLEIGGHTDDTGSEVSNQILSEKRAKAVYEYLVDQGVHITRIKYKGYGESKPIVPNDTEENKAKNRRTAFKVLGF